tara:strand:+ start:172 stop:1131 length:960 start_codon:yes stop_codon:yes gene_type:complete
MEHGQKNQSDYLAKEEDVDLKELFTVLWKGKSRIIITTFIASVLSVYFALSLPNIYRSSSILSPVSHQSGNLGGISGAQMGGIASLAGISLPNDSSDKTLLGIEVLKSMQFFSKFSSENDVLVPLMASTGWNMQDNSLIINKEIYDSTSGKWVRDFTPPRKAKPSIQEAHDVFMSLLSISQDTKTGFIAITIDHYSPFIAKQWLGLIIDELNNSVRSQDIANAELAIDYLKEEIDATKLTKIQSGLYDLILTQAEKKVLAKATPEYVFQIIDPPFVPELKNSPKRAVICILGAILGGILGVFSVLIQHYFIKPYQIKVS